MTHIPPKTSRGQINTPIKDLLSLKGSIASQKKFKPKKSKKAFGEYLANQSK